MNHQARRARLLEESGSGLILVRGAGRGGTNPNFLYLTGIDEPRAALLMAPDGVRIETGRAYPGRDYVRGRMACQVLFLPVADPLAARWGEDAAATLGSVDADAVGVDAVLAVGAFEGVFEAALARAAVLHYVRALGPSLIAAPDVDTTFVERVRRNYFDVRVSDATPRVHEMRRLKDAGEVLAIERSIRVTHEALDAVTSAMAAGVGESALEAEIVRIYRRHGAVHAFDPIVASGPNAMKLHYKQNTAELSRGDLLLVDTGASLAGYSADITRTYPVDGRFTSRQREVYETVLRAQIAAIEACRPGGSLAEVHERAFEVIDAGGFGEYFPHGTAHHLGLETHDVGDVHRELAPGAVITVEPGVYLPDEGIGVRIEDDVLITGDGHRNLSAAIPKTVDEIEAALTGS